MAVRRGGDDRDGELVSSFFPFFFSSSRPLFSPLLRGREPEGVVKDNQERTGKESGQAEKAPC